MKLTDLQKIVEQRTKGEWKYSKSSHFEVTTHSMRTFFRVKSPNKFIDLACETHECNEFEFIATIANHIDEIMDVLRAAKELTEVTDAWLREYGWCPDHLHPDDKFRLLKEALDRLENK